MVTLLQHQKASRWARSIVLVASSKESALRSQSHNGTKAKSAPTTPWETAKSCSITLVTRSDHDSTPRRGAIPRWPVRAKPHEESFCSLTDAVQMKWSIAGAFQVLVRELSRAVHDIDTTDREHSVGLIAPVEGEDGLHFCIDRSSLECELRQLK